MTTTNIFLTYSSPGDWEMLRSTLNRFNVTILEEKYPVLMVVKDLPGELKPYMSNRHNIASMNDVEE